MATFINTFLNNIRLTRNNFIKSSPLGKMFTKLQAIILSAILSKKLG